MIEKKQRQITVAVSEDLYKYLTFLEKRRLIKSKEQAVETSLNFYKMLALYEWLPYIYRMGGERVVLIDAAVLKDLFHALTTEEIYTAAKMSAYKLKLRNPLLKDVDLSDPENWPLALRSLEIMGWGKFTKVKNEIKIEFCPLPAPYVLGYLETLFKVEFKQHLSKVPDVIVFSTQGEKKVVLDED